MLELLTNAMAAAPMGCKVTIQFHQADAIKDVTIIAADSLGIVTESSNMDVLHRMVPWTAIQKLYVHQY